MSMMNYRRDNNRTSWIKVAILAIVFVILFVVLLGISPVITRVDRGVFTSQSGWNDTLVSLTHTKQQLLERINSLETYVTIVEQQNTMLRSFHDEVVPFSDMHHGIVAAVIRGIAKSPLKTFTIDRGQQDGVNKGDDVVFGDIMIGTVSQVDGTSAHVLPLFAPGNEIEARHGQSMTALSLVGQGNGVYQALVPREFNIAVDDGIFALDSRTQGIIGYVDTIEVDDRDALQTVFVRMPINPRTLQWVEVIGEMENAL